MRSRAQSYRNLDGLQADRDAVNWYWRLTAAASSTMILGGFLMLPATYVKVDTLRVNQTAIGIFGLAILTAGFSFSALLTFTIRNPLFQADAIHQPCALASIVGLLTVFYDFIISNSYTWKTPTLLLAIAAGLSTIIYASLFLLSQRRISKIRSRPQPSSGSSIHPLTMTSPSRTSFASPAATPYEPSNLEPVESRRPSTYQSPGFYENYIRNMYPTSAHSNNNINNNNAPGAPASSTGDLSYDPHSISEEEMQRQQMLMLLLANEQPAHQQQLQQSTFHIDWQGQDGDGDETPAHGYYAPGAETTGSSSDGGVGTGGSWPTPPPPPPVQPQSSPGKRWKGALKPWDGVWRGVARRDGQRRGEQIQQQQDEQRQQYEQQQQQHQHHLHHQRSAEGREERRREIELGYR
jgi:hypothetical protein